MTIKAKRRGFVKFQQKSHRPPLSREQFEYWMDMLPKILKVGTEFEINLPDASQALQVKEETPCLHSTVAATAACAKDCTNLEDCLVDRHPAFCLTRGTGKFLGKDFACPATRDSDTKSCRTCPAWMLNCRGSNCAMYSPACSVCPSFLRKGEVIESGNIRKDAETIRREVRDILQPSGFVGETGSHGALEVKKDNSLINNGGIEVPTVGRRVHWNSFYKMCQDILTPIVERGGFVNERCGQHYHILAGYFDEQSGLRGRCVSEMEEPLPEIILANLHQLHRRYQLAMFWIMSAGTRPEHLTRWAKFRQSIYKFSALRNAMPRVQAELAEHVVSMNNNQKGKYASVAYHFCKFNPEGNASVFHIENRIADGTLSPAVASAWGMLCYALVLKAVRLSQYGTMESGDADYNQMVKQIQPHLIDGEQRDWGSDRNANTAGLHPYIPWLRENTVELINFLKPELHGLGPAYEILMSLANRPCSARLISGDSWEKIEADLMEEAGFKRSRGSEDDIREVVDLAGIVDCENVEAWIEEVSAHLGQNTAVVSDAVSQMTRSGRYRWSQPIGALITT